MYEKLTTNDGASAVVGYVGTSNVQPDADGLVVAPPVNAGTIHMPDRLMDWLVDIRLMRYLPVVYLVPDSALLPTESIRFFHVDTTWLDRVMDGIFSAANTGTIDTVYDTGVLASTRKAVDDELALRAKASVPGSTWSVDSGMTGMLIRSELARRWPDMIVQAWDDYETMAKPVPVLRSEPISRDIYIALFAGQPKMVTVREPFSGVRFGVEPSGTSPSGYKVDSRNTNGTNILQNQNPVPLNIAWRGAGAYRVINFQDLANISVDHTSRHVAINLEQKPYLQEFKDTRDEALGSQELTAATPPMAFRKGRYMKLDQLRLQLEQQRKAGA